MELNKKAPRYLLESRTLTGSVIFIVLFSILFMVIYAPYSSTSWLTLMAQEQELGDIISGFRMAMASVAFYLVAIAFLILSKVVLHQVHRQHPITNGQLVLWVGGEVIMEAFIYTVFTELFVFDDPNLFLQILGRAVMVLSFILIVLSFPDFSRRFFASLAEKIYTFSLAILSRFTLSPIPCCSA